MNALDLAKTGGMFDGEAAGNIGWANELQQKTSAFGQSTTVTPAQMIQAQSAFFNKGNMLKPWFVSSIDNPITKKIITLVKRVCR